MNTSSYDTLYPEMIALFRAANKEFLKNESTNIKTEVSERSLCGAFMLNFRSTLDSSIYNKYHVDIEYNRNFGKQVKTIVHGKEEPIEITCDLIVHSRGECILQDNLIALEMKRCTHKKADKDKDRLRLMCLTKDTFDDIWSYDGTVLPQHVCRYILGVYYELDLSSSCVRVSYYKKGFLESQETFKLC